MKVFVIYCHTLFLSALLQFDTSPTIMYHLEKVANEDYNVLVVHSLAKNSGIE